VSDLTEEKLSSLVLFICLCMTKVTGLMQTTLTRITSGGCFWDLSINLMGVNYKRLEDLNVQKVEVLHHCPTLPSSIA